uniref:Uncharacterized protein n=1 Tax=Aplanochytrium stocchinoi TaxID=215587 RepID=A0A7S3V0U1_9STRA
MKKFWALLNHAMGNCLIAYKQYKEIIEETGSCIQADQGGFVPEKTDVLLNSDIRLLLSSLCLRMRRPREALRHTNCILQSPDAVASPNALLNQGIAYAILGHTEQALEPISKALEIVDSHKGTINQKHITANIGIALSRMYYNRCAVRYFLHVFDAAKNDCDEAIYLEPSNPEMYWFRAKIYAAEFLKREAMRDFHSAIELCRTGGKSSDFGQRRLSVSSNTSTLTAESSQ